MTSCFVGLGANIGDPREQLREAVASLRCQPQVRDLKLSPVYRSAPMGPPDQPDYLNAVAQFTTVLAPEALLDLLQDLEQRAGRERGRHWGPRTLDLDLLLYGDQCISSARLRVPHPGLAGREFVLVPLHDLVGGDFTLPGGERLGVALARCSSGALTRVATPDQLLAREVCHGEP